MNVRTWIYIGSQSFLIQFVVWGLRPAASYHALSLGTRAADLTILAAAFALPALVIAIPAGRLTDRWGPRFSMVAGGVVCLAATALIWWQSASVVWLCVGLGGAGIGLLTATTGQQTLVMHRCAPGRADAAFGLYTVFVSLGQLAGPAVMGVMTGPDGDPRFSGIVAVEVGGSALLAAVALMPAGSGLGRGSARAATGRGAVRAAVGREAVSGGGSAAGRVVVSGRGMGSGREVVAGREAGPTKRERMTVLGILRMPGMLPAVVASSLALASIDALYTYLPAIGEARGLSAGTVSAALMVFGFMAMASRVSLGVITRAVGRRRTLVVGCAVSAGVLVLMGAPLWLWAMFVCVGLFGFMSGMVQPLTMSWTSDLAPEQVRGTVTSLRMLGNRVGQVGVPVVSGAVMTLVGAAGAFVLSGVTMAAAGWSVWRSRYWARPVAGRDESNDQPSGVMAAGTEEPR
ncbi:MAG: MFS transporter [Bifidobacteriaceae bacterium]|jgi:predicted MFS family arabinose efflux permease|nr:MFS transporter [Bifidobacteriaceae bacterium]